MKIKINILCIILIIAISAAISGCTKQKEDAEPLATPSVTKEDLELEIDWEQAEADGAIITSDDTDVIVPAEPITADLNYESDTIVQLESETSYRSVAPPNKVWDSVDVPDYINDKFTLPEAVMMDDGSVGKLTIAKIGVDVSVYETDDAIESLAIGLAHMKETSCWAGNVGIAGHNSGVNTHFANLHKLEAGDEISFTTALGTRIYQVQNKKEIDELDWSEFHRSDSNMLTLITCVDHDATKRLCIRAVEKTA